MDNFGLRNKINRLAPPQPVAQAVCSQTFEWGNFRAVSQLCRVAQFTSTVITHEVRADSSRLSTASRG
ncbi:hypothetical protein EMIT0158MI4_120228 [Burkholderia ambifaria]